MNRLNHMFFPRNTQAFINISYKHLFFQIRENDLRGRLSQREWMSIIGNSSPGESEKKYKKSLQYHRKTKHPGNERTHNMGTEQESWCIQNDLVLLY